MCRDLYGDGEEANILQVCSRNITFREARGCIFKLLFLKPSLVLVDLLIKNCVGAHYLFFITIYIKSNSFMYRAMTFDKRTKLCVHHCWTDPPLLKISSCFHFVINPSLCPLPLQVFSMYSTLFNICTHLQDVWYWFFLLSPLHSEVEQFVCEHLSSPFSQITTLRHSGFPDKAQENQFSPENHTPSFQDSGSVLKGYKNKTRVICGSGSALPGLC